MFLAKAVPQERQTACMISWFLAAASYVNPAGSSCSGVGEEKGRKVE
jgi:hypothetical protein